MPIQDGSIKRKGKRVIGVRGTSIIVEKDYSIEEAFEHFVRVKDNENVRKSTREEYFNLYRYFNEWLTAYHAEIKTIKQLTTYVIREYISYLANEKPRYEGNQYVSEYRKQGKGLSPYTVNIRIRFLKSLFNVLVKDEMLLRSPMENIKLLRVDEDIKEPLTENEIRMLLKQPDQILFAQYRDYIMMMLMLDSGMRVNEICSLEIEDIDTKSRCINLPAAKNKNRKGRVIPISRHVVRLLDELILETKQYFDTSHVFVSNFGEPLHISSFRKSLYNYAEKAGIKKSVSPHAFRHFYAKQAALNGMDIFSLQRILGHADISTTRKYVQLEKEDLINQHDLYSPLQKIVKRR